MGNNEHVRDFLKYYCDLPKEPQYAVLLTGLWGCGKTWFVKDFISNHLGQPERVLYLSLYGVQSFDDIEVELFRLLHPILGSKQMRTLRRVAGGFLKATIKIDIDGDGKADDSVSGSIPTEKIFEKLAINSDRILILDDLERCSIPVADILGYVNQFIEHGGLKGVLIANEVELHKDNSEPNSSYSRIKEKLIGRTFEIVPEVDSALEYFAADLATPRVQQIVRNNAALIKQVYECSKYNNLRIVRHALWDFDRLSKSFDESVFSSDRLLSDILALFLAYSLEVRNGAIKPKEIEKLQDDWSFFSRADTNQSNPNQHIHDIKDKYAGLKLYTSLIAEPVWIAIFTTGSIPSFELNESLLKSKYFQDANQPNWVKLWYGMNLSDEAFASVLESVDSEWNDRVYTNLGVVVHVTGLFVRYAKCKIYNQTVEQVIDSAKKYVDQLIGNEDIPTMRPNNYTSLFDRESYAGLAFASTDEEDFRIFIEYIYEQRRNALAASLPSKAMDLLALVEEDTDMFYTRIIHNNNPENIFYNTPILHHIPSAQFIERLIRIAPDKRRVVAYALGERYRVEEFNIKLLPELDWLRQIANLLRSEITTRVGKVSSLSLRMILDPYIIQAINQLEQVRLSPRA